MSFELAAFYRNIYNVTVAGLAAVEMLDGVCWVFVGMRMKMKNYWQTGCGCGKMRLVCGQAVNF